MNLDRHGAACRCLLRLRENAGQPGMSDAAFIARFLPRYPEWRDRPGAADVAMLTEIASELQLATTLNVARSYDRVLKDHRAGLGILVQTERVPLQVEPTPPAGRHVSLLVAMSEEQFSLWCPYSSGNSETLTAAKREWWDRWWAIAFILGQTDIVPVAD
jgi:hypothetical protein